MGAEYKPVVLKEFEREGRVVAGGVADGDKPEVPSGFGAEVGTGAVEEEAVGGSWPEAAAVSGPAVAGGEGEGEGDAAAVEKPLRSY